MNKFYILVLPSVATALLLTLANHAKGEVATWIVSGSLLIHAILCYAIAAMSASMFLTGARARNIRMSDQHEVNKLIPNWTNALVSIALASVVSAAAVWLP